MKISKLIISSMVLATALTALSANAKIEQYTLKSDARIGSNIPTIDMVSPVPFNKRFNELSDEQKAHVVANFKNLPANSSPPFPVKGMKAIYKPIISKSKKLSHEGKLHLVAIVNQNGRVESVTVEQGDNPRLTRYAEKVLLRTPFDPAVCNGAPCQMEFPIAMNFSS